MVEEKKKGSITAKQGLIIFFLIVGIGVLLFGIAQVVLLITDNQLASNSDIDGFWNSTATEYSYIFIPKNNIDNLEITFSIRDKNNQELQEIVKNVGNVKTGQQYTVSFNITELKEIATIIDFNYTTLTVTGGYKKAL